MVRSKTESNYDGPYEYLSILTKGSCEGNYWHNFHAQRQFRTAWQASKFHVAETDSVGTGVVETLVPLSHHSIF